MMRLWVAILAVMSAVPLQAATETSVAGPSELIRVELPREHSELLERIVSVFARKVGERCPAKVITQGDASVTVHLAIDPAIGTEGFRISDRAGGGIEVAGQNERGVLYGLGKLLRTSRYSEEGFTSGTWRGTSVPQKPNRGIYFCCHFHNFYHEAPQEKVERYVEDLALWGFNELLVWSDLHHFNGNEDPEAVKYRARLHAILQSAKRIGMDVSITLLGNEGYANSPAEIRATPGAGRGGYYDCGVCPSNPKGMDYLLKIHGETFDWVADLKPRTVWIWPYDQGSCGCVDCRPWGSNGFMKCVKALGPLAREKLPGTKIMLSTWYLDNAEWRGILPQLAQHPGLVDGFVAQPIAGPAIGPKDTNLPIVGFPEISMHQTFPWGGFGATPLTARARKEWDAVKATVSGGYPYSEGIYEDMTKVVYSQFYWNDRPVEETVQEYIAFEFSPEVVEEVAGVVKTLEQNHHYRWWPGKLEGVKLEMNWFPSRKAKPQADLGAETAYATMRRIDGQLSPQARTAWRWRLLYLRALLDAELKANGGSPNDRCYEAFTELIEIYHAQNANPVVRPPLPKDWKKIARDPSVTASSELDGLHHAGKASDGILSDQDANNFWACANQQDKGSWWRKDMGEVASIREVQIQFRSVGGRYYFVPKTITIQVSDDGEHWTTALAQSADVPANMADYEGKMHSYLLDAKGRYLRLLFEDGTEHRVGDSKVVELVEAKVITAEASATP